MTKVGRFLIHHPLYSILIATCIVIGGVIVTPFYNFASDLGFSSLPIDAMPDLGENQQIVYCTWPGYTPEDVESRIIFPLTSALMGIPQVKHIRSNSMFGFASIYLIFEEDTDFYWCRSRILEKLSTLKPGTLPPGVEARLGPDATAMNQIFWYTLEGRDRIGNATGGWNLTELRSVQDEYVKPRLQSCKGVAEVASVGGKVKAYSVKLKPEALRRLRISVNSVAEAIRKNNRDAGGQTMEINRAEYYIRGIGQLKTTQDIKNILLQNAPSSTPVYIGDVAEVLIESRDQTGILDKGGAELAGGIITAQISANPKAVIDEIKLQIERISRGMPERVLADGRTTKLTIVPFYDRSLLIEESNTMLGHTLWVEILIALIVLLFFTKRADTTLLAVFILPLGIGLVFLSMKGIGLRANIAALVGIAIAIGTMIDMAIIFLDNVIQKQKSFPNASADTLVTKANKSVGPAILTAGLTTIVTFLPLLALPGQAGKLFTPLVITKSLALTAALLITLFVLPGITKLILQPQHAHLPKWGRNLFIGLLTIMVIYYWQPLPSFFLSTLYVGLSVGVCLITFQAVIKHYDFLLDLVLRYAQWFLGLIGLMIVFSIMILRDLPQSFLPSVDEGSFLVMPTTTANAGIKECKELLQILDMSISGIPEISEAIGKAGRAESALDPAPLSMFEILAHIQPEYKKDKKGNRIRQWRDHIKNRDDIWNEIVSIIAQIPGLTIPPKLYPIETRLLMLQSGMKGGLGIKVTGHQLDTIASFASKLEKELSRVEGVIPSTVFSSQLESKPYIEIIPDRKLAAAYGFSTNDILSFIELTIGEQTVSSIQEYKKNYNIHLKWSEDIINTPADIAALELINKDGKIIPLGTIASVNYKKGVQVIRGEDGFLIQYVFFSKEAARSTLSVVDKIKDHLNDQMLSGQLEVPVGVTFSIEGDHIQQQKTTNRLIFIGGLALLLLIAVLYFQFRSIALSGIVFTGILVACAGGFISIWLWNQEWFLNFPLIGSDLRSLLSIGFLPLNTPVWIGFLVLVGIATDDGVLMATYLQNQLREDKCSAKTDLLPLLKKAGRSRIKAAMMTTATTLLALLPVLAAQDKGSELMAPMAVPVFGGMLFQIITTFTVPVLWRVWKIKSLKDG